MERNVIKPNLCKETLDNAQKIFPEEKGEEQNPSANDAVSWFLRVAGVLIQGCV